MIQERYRSKSDVNRFSRGSRYDQAIDIGNIFLQLFLNL